MQSKRRREKIWSCFSFYFNWNLCVFSLHFWWVGKKPKNKKTERKKYGNQMNSNCLRIIQSDLAYSIIWMKRAYDHVDMTWIAHSILVYKYSYTKYIVFTKRLWKYRESFCYCWSPCWDELKQSLIVCASKQALFRCTKTQSFQKVRIQLASLHHPDPFRSHFLFLQRVHSSLASLSLHFSVCFWNTVRF